MSTQSPHAREDGRRTNDDRPVYQVVAQYKPKSSHRGTVTPRSWCTNTSKALSTGTLRVMRTGAGKEQNVHA